MTVAPGGRGDIAAPTHILAGQIRKRGSRVVQKLGQGGNGEVRGVQTIQVQVELVVVIGGLLLLLLVGGAGIADNGLVSMVLLWVLGILLLLLKMEV